MAGSVIPAGYEGSVCEIKTTENTFITTGRISSVSGDKIKLHIKSKAFRSVPFGFRVKINIVNSKLGFRVIEGKVYTYSFGILTLTDIFGIVDKERRSSFRVDMNLALHARYENTYTGRAASADITIKNMSINGVKFTSSHHFDMGAVLSFGLQLNKRKYVDLTCRIIRRSSDGRNGSMSYIGRIVDNTENEDAVCSLLLQKQGELLNHAK